MIEWFNENELRSYPIVENKSRKTSDGRVLPNNVIADLSVTIDADLTEQVYVSSVGITPSLASIGIATASGGILLATVENPVPMVPYRLEPLVENVSGFVVFGSGVTVASAASYAFSGPGQTGLEGKAVRPFETPPVRSLGKVGSQDPPLHGVVNIAVDGDLYLRRDGNTIYIGLKEGVRPLYVGPCDRIIDYITCGKPPLREINGVGPDGSGKITIEVQ